MVLTPFVVGAQVSAPLQSTTTRPVTIPTLSDQLKQQISALETSRNAVYEQRADPTTLNADLFLKFLNVKISPKNPGPSQPTTITIESYASNLDKASIRWEINGKTALQGTGNRTYTFVTGPSGKTTVVDVHITTNTGVTVTKEISITPLGIALLWQAETYTPPFYRGKALPSPQSLIRVVAIPDGSGTLSAGSFAYTWQKDSNVSPSASGFGKNSFFFPAPKPYGKATVKVTVSSIYNSQSTDASINILPTQPFVLFYETTPLLGTWYNKPIANSYDLTKREVSISAEPYYFSNEQTDAQTLQYNWTINGTAAQNFDRTITLRNDTSTQGDSIVALAMSSVQKTFQFATQSLKIHLGESSASSGQTLF